MTHARDLQKRLNRAFTGEAARTLPATDRANPAQPGQPRQSATASAVKQSASRLGFGRSGYGPQLLWFGGIWLMLSGLALALGATAGYFAVVIALVIVLIALGFSLLFQWRAERILFGDTLVASTEGIADGEWSRHEHANLLFAVHDVMHDIAVIREMDGTILRANIIFREIMNCSQPEGRRIEDFGLQFRPGTRRSRFDVDIATPRGTRIYAWHDVVLRDPGDGHLVIQSIGRDMTEEAMLMRSRDEARQRAERESAAKSRLLATVSHDIRTPLGGILGMTKLLSLTGLTAEQRNYLDGIRHSGAALSQLTGELLDFSAIEAGHFTLRPAPEKIRPLIESVVEMLAYRAHEKDIEIAAAIGPEIPDTIEIDGPRLRQVLFNLIGNAVKFTYQGGVLVTAGICEGALTIAVEDSGPGLSPDEQARIFDDYSQAGTLRDQAQGTGLGLSISARILREFGGDITLTSVAGQGSTFTIRLPLGVPRQGLAHNPRLGLLAASAVLMLGPEGPAARALRQTVTALGGRFERVESPAVALARLQEPADGNRGFTDLIVDHRFGEAYAREVESRPVAALLSLRKILLVNPEERRSRFRSKFDAWLVRPLREQSLCDVLRGRMRGMEQRRQQDDDLPPRQPRNAITHLPRGLDILIGEDDPVSAMLVRTVLERAGHQVTVVSNFAALSTRAAEFGGADVIITDLGMPGGDGFSFIEDLRRMEVASGRRRLPIIVLTADVREETARHALFCGASRVLAKPADPMHLLAEISALSAVVPRATVA